MPTDAHSLEEYIDQLEAIEGIKRGLESKKRGEGITLEEFDKEMRRKHKILARPMRQKKKE